MKERLTGAIIVVALLVLLVPELLTGPESWQPAKPAGAAGAQLRSYTIDLQDGAADRQQPSAPTVAASDEAVGQATPEAEAESPPVASVTPPVDEASRAAGKPMGSGADEPAAQSEPAATAPPSVEDERPRSAFGPNARTQSEQSSGSGASKPDAAAKSSEAAKAAAAKVEAQKAEAQRAEVAKAEARKAEAARAAAAKAESAKPPSAPEAKPDATRVAAAKPESLKSGGSKGWAVQLGVFGSRGNAERLAKQVRGSGFPVLVNETSGKDGKKLYWVRVGPEPEQARAAALSAKLKAAGHRDARVVAYP